MNENKTILEYAESVFGQKSELDDVPVKTIAAEEAASVFVDNKEQ